MSQFRKLVENILKENDYDWAAFDNNAAIKLDYENQMDHYVEELIRYGEVTIDNGDERRKFHDYIYGLEDDLPFDPENLRREGNLIYLA